MVSALETMGFLLHGSKSRGASLSGEGGTAKGGQASCT